MSRVLVGLWGLWFTALLTGVHGWHSCARHDAHAHGAASHGARAPHATHVMAMGAAHGSGGPRSAEASVQENVPVSACSCLGSCCATDGALVPGSAASTLAVVPMADHPAPSLPDERAPASRRPHAHPFANAPPARLAAFS
jgi:hypothetical protein